MFFSSLQAQAFEDYIIATNGKLTDILIENNQLVDVFPLITVMNEKNTLIVHPLKEGITCFTVRKNEKEKYLFNIKITEEKTTILPVDGFDILSIDIPPTENYSLPFESLELENYDDIEWLDPPKLIEEVS
jgi:hypothetical protein